jgi:hypothetical protein
MLMIVDFALVDLVLMSEDQLHVKLADFGLARETEVEEWATSYCGVSAARAMPVPVVRDR